MMNGRIEVGAWAKGWPDSGAFRAALAPALAHARCRFSLKRPCVYGGVDIRTMGPTLRPIIARTSAGCRISRYRVCRLRSNRPWRACVATTKNARVGASLKTCQSSPSGSHGAHDGENMQSCGELTLPRIMSIAFPLQAETKTSGSVLLSFQASDHAV
jgi:hypothetical protein